LIEINAVPVEARQARAMTPPGRPFRIAVVENDAPLLSALAFALEAEGWEVATFQDPIEALEGIGSVDCLLVGDKLPQIDGLTLIARLREQGVTAPAVLITAGLDPRRRRRADAPEVAIVEKPLVAEELKRRIQAALGEAKP
jgi:DNA-binding response OmpR family regulator